MNRALPSGSITRLRISTEVIADGELKQHGGYIVDVSEGLEFDREQLQQILDKIYAVTDDLKTFEYRENADDPRLLSILGKHLSPEAISAMSYKERMAYLESLPDEV